MAGHPNLFDPPGAVDPVSDRRAVVRGDFGEIRWGCGTPPAGRADEAWAFGSGRIFAWDRRPFRVELALLRAVPDLPPGMHVHDAWIGYWRLRGDTDGVPPELTCWVAIGIDRLDGGPDNGEALDAQTWENRQHRVSIGTEDSDALADATCRSVGDQSSLPVSSRRRVAGGGPRKRRVDLVCRRADPASRAVAAIRPPGSPGRGSARQCSVARQAR